MYNYRQGVVIYLLVTSEIYSVYTDTFVLSELVEKGIDVLITGVTLDNKYTRAAHEMARENAINILGGTHYSSEKFACMEVCKYFDGLGLLATFVEDAPCFEDM